MSRYTAAPPAIAVKSHGVAVAIGEKIHNFLLEVADGGVLPAFINSLIFPRQRYLHIERRKKQSRWGVEQPCVGNKI